MEKIKISVDLHTYNILMKDTEMFEFYKADNVTLNKNALLTNILVNFHDTFNKKQTELFDYLKNTIAKETFLKESQVLSLSYEISKGINRQENSSQNDIFDHTINLKPTTKSAPIVDYIENYLLRGSSLSEYFRNMLVSYSKLPQDEREKIIFKAQYDELIKAINSKKRVFITTRNADKSFEACPYKLTPSKEELHYYLLSVSGGTLCPLRLSNILSVKILLDDASFDANQVAIFEKMIKYGPQYQYSSEEKEVKVCLTDRGIDKFKRMYVHRPVPDRIEDNNYYFNCSYNQLIQYFVRFGKDAFVEYPAEVQSQMLSFFSQAKRVYFNKMGLKKNKGV